ncbi:hypothetical protein LF63_0100575 [Oleiagrimonas soli]|uniref:Uncharacterized protein n=2 Tax=Oleiagrimonas soli TaxID=1543381 RepID=A0A099CYW6_9GAMM|nr:hypothetical protein LF63_0100575 [Oleiagrimonas soli]
MGTVHRMQNRGQRARLRQAQQQRQLIRLWRGDMEHGSFSGYVAGVGREFFLLHVIGDGISDDGLYAMRHRDVTELELPDRHARFIDRAVVLKGIAPRQPLDFPLDDVTQVIKAAAKRAPVIGVHVDSEDEAEVCYIGRLLQSDDDGFGLQEISPDAEWLREVSQFGWDEVSTVSMHDPYASALLAVAGPAPALEPGDAGIGHLS